MPETDSPPVAGPLGAVTTERLLLRPFERSDVDALATVFAKPEIWHFPYGRGFNRNETESFLDAQIESWETNGYGCWLAVGRDGGPIVGYIGLSVPRFLPEILPAVEVGWRLDPDHWGHGLATEGARAALLEGFTTLGLDEIVSVPQADNPPSVRVCDRIGLRFDRAVTIPANDRRGELDGSLYRLSATDWRSGLDAQE